MLGWLAQLAQVALVCLPVIAAFIGLAAVGATLYGAIAGLSSLAMAVSSYIITWIDSLTLIVNDMKTGGSNLGWILIILQALNIPLLLRLLATLAAYVATVISGFVAIGSSVLVACGAVWLFRKVKLLANVLAGQGAME